MEIVRKSIAVNMKLPLCTKTISQLEAESILKVILAVAESTGLEIEGISKSKRKGSFQALLIHKQGEHKGKRARVSIDVEQRPDSLKIVFSRDLELSFRVFCTSESLAILETSAYGKSLRLGLEKN